MAAKILSEFCLCFFLNTLSTNLRPLGETFVSVMYEAEVVMSVVKLSILER